MIFLLLSVGEFLTHWFEHTCRNSYFLILCSFILIIVLCVMQVFCALGRPELFVLHV